MSGGTAYEKAVIPARGGAAVTPSNTVPLANTSRALFIGGAGNIKLTMANGDVVTVNGVVAGALYPWAVTLVWATGTTATNIVAFY